MSDSIPQPPKRRLRRIAGRARPFFSAAALTALALGAIGQAARDRNIVLALLMYIPLVPVGVGAALLDFICRGRCVPRVRFGLAVAGLVAAAWGSTLMVGTRAPEPAAADASEVTLLHWNVMWGGRDHSISTWRKTAEQIVRRNPDLVVLSEAPSDDMIVDALAPIGPGWQTVYITNEPGSPYWYNPFVCSRGPLKLERRVPIRNGAAMSVLAEVRGRTVRLLVVDGKSDPRILRTPMLHDIAAACDEAARKAEPFDVVVGDFNSMGRSVGFDALAGAGGAGYRRAAEYCGGWRATWPFPLPVFDIDHVWVRRAHAVLHCEMFSSPRTDHRGQFVRLALTPEK